MTDQIDPCRSPGCRTTPSYDYALRGLCQRHEAEGRGAVAALHDDWLGLRALTWQKSSSGTPAGYGLGLPAVGQPFGPSEPVNLAADELAGEIAYTTVMWEIAVRERARLAEVDDATRPTGADLERAVGILAAHFSVLLALPTIDYLTYDRRLSVADGPDAALGLMRLHRRAAGHAGVTRPVGKLPGVCSVCGWQVLRHRDGSENVYCGNCHAKWTWDEYQDAVGLVELAGAA